MSKGELKVAIVHDELTRRGGAEVVLEEMLRIWPEADVYALYAGQPQMIVDGRKYDIKTSWLQRWPEWWRRHPSRLLPWLSHAAEQFDLASYDVVISSASGFAKSIITRVNVPHVCYCHTPVRYLWDSTHEVVRQTGRGRRWLVRPILHYLRLADFAAAQRVDRWLANSHYTQSRISTYYRQDSKIVYPPVDTSFFTPLRSSLSLRATGDTAPFLIAGRLSRMKYFDQAIKVCEKLQLPLVVVGVGREIQRLRKLAGQYTKFVGQISQIELRKKYRTARALIQPGVEDFGMAATEALACGTPVIALGRGGVKEIVRHRETGILYNEAREEALAEGIRQFLAEPGLLNRELMQQSTLKFARARFQNSIREQVNQVVN